jgi:L-ribulose-5-phosphate 3-epimerase
MSRFTDRRQFLKGAALGIGAGLLAPSRAARAAGEDKPLFKISLAEWSLHRTLREGKLDHLDFPQAAKNDYGIEACEYVNQFFKDKAEDQQYLAELKQRCSDLGVRSVLIMCDGEGALGDPSEAARTKAVENHFKWVTAAKFLGCHSIRVNAQSKGSEEEQQKLVTDGLRRLAEFGATHQINVVVENHGGLSSHGDWLTSVIKAVDLPNCGTLPDFGNFYDYDRYQGVTDMMPFAKGVSAKSHDFDAEGNDTLVDFRRMLAIVLDAGYHGYLGIEYEGNKLPEPEGIHATKKLLEKIRKELSPKG